MYGLKPVHTSPTFSIEFFRSLLNPFSRGLLKPAVVAVIYGPTLEAAEKDRIESEDRTLSG
jgi:hypothetical protein